jgi:hypothetical protein
VSEREWLPKMNENCILIKFKEEIKGVIEEILKDQPDITDVNNFIYTASTIMTQK